MCDSINYNLKYFIMKMSGTKPMKNTMRKQSPLKFIGGPNPVVDAAKKVSEAASSAVSKRETMKGWKAMKAKKDAAVEGKPSAKPSTSKSPYAAMKVKLAEKKAAKSTGETSIKTKTPAAKPTTKTPAMQMKKTGMKKKC